MTLPSKHDYRYFAERRPDGKLTKLMRLLEIGGDPTGEHYVEGEWVGRERDAEHHPHPGHEPEEIDADEAAHLMRELDALHPSEEADPDDAAHDFRRVDPGRSVLKH